MERKPFKGDVLVGQTEDSDEEEGEKLDCIVTKEI
jgi:hypothetical protein